MKAETTVNIMQQFRTDVRYKVDDVIQKICAVTETVTIKIF
jgi:hypothetical protein